MSHTISASAAALDRLLKSNDAVAEVVRRSVHRTMLWRFRTGERVPNVETAGRLHALTGGIVPADGWVRESCPPAHAEPAAAPEQEAPAPHEPAIEAP